MLRGESDHLRQYVFTMDLASKIRSLGQYGLTVPEINDPIFAETDQELIRQIENILPSCKVCPIDMTVQAQQMIERAAELDTSSAMGSSMTVSTCQEVSFPT